MDDGAIQLITFSWYDYALFIIILALSTVIGIYFGFFGNRQSSADEYLKGGKKMKLFPIAMSQISSHISGILLLAVPADVYFYGTTYVWSLVSIIWVGSVMPLVYLPVFYKMQLTSVYEYLEVRFDKRLRTTSSFLFLISSFLYLPIVIYVPALAFSQVTEVRVHLITPIVCAVCIFYTTIGGLKAVVWTDTLQFGAMIGGIVAVVVIGIKTVGGFGEIYVKSLHGQRFDWDTSFTLFKRDTVWALSFGMCAHWMSNICINQGTIQKFLSLPTMTDIKRSLVVFMVGMFTFKCSSILIGLLMYTRYHDCDPFTLGNVVKHDQMLPYFIMDVARKVPGLPGLFISGIFCAALSTLSAVMNSLGGTIYEDFVSPFMPKDITQKTVSNILKLIVFLTGVISLGLIFVVERLGGIFPLAISFAGATGGPLLGTFTLGLLVPSANAKGALAGAITSMITMFSLLIPTQFYRFKGYLTYEPKPLRTDGCSGNFTVTPTNATLLLPNDLDEPWEIFKLSPYFYTIIGVLIVFIVAIPVSKWTARKGDIPVDPDLISPVAHRFLPKQRHEMESVYYSVGDALKIIK